MNRVAAFIASIPFLAGCATMTQSELEQCAAAAQAKVEWEQDAYDRWEAMGQQPAVFVGHDTMAEMAQRARQKILERNSTTAEPCPIDRPTSQMCDFGYTNSKIEERITPLVEKFRDMKPRGRREIVRNCYDRLMR